jgi:DNA-binding MarR family transcriptional regulator
MDRRRPIGWWVRRLDVLLEESLDAAVAAQGLTRRHWQVLHSLADSAVPETSLGSTLADFPGDVGAVVRDLVDRGWVASPDHGEIALTPTGRSVHARAATAVGALRRQVVAGIGDEEYGVVIDVLSRMVENLGPTPCGSRPQPRR